MKRFAETLLRAALMTLLLVGAPLLGLVAAGRPVAPYLEFPPHTRFVTHAPFSWTAFALIGLLVLVCSWPFVRLAAAAVGPTSPPAGRHTFPWWGWIGIVGVAVSWVTAWNRWNWFAPLQPHTFPMLWGGFILVVNALIYRRRGTCLMLAQPARFALLFPASAVFWWFFEYLNRFVQNWYYTGVDYPPLTYFTLASLSFATVLPAVLSVRELLLSFKLFQGRHRPLYLPRWMPAPLVALTLLAVATTGLAGVGLWPDYLFPLLWSAPLAILLGLQMLGRRGPLLAALAEGRWPVWAAAALAGLVCGFFWEMWNFHSLARWVYTVPWVDRFHLFEMPLLGYAGYLPFGLECALIGDILIQPTD
jgi:hypothetical protein